jgi:hypothetical protein
MLDVGWREERPRQALQKSQINDRQSSIATGVERRIQPAQPVVGESGARQHILRHLLSGRRGRPPSGGTRAAARAEMEKTTDSASAASGDSPARKPAASV